MFSCMLRQGIVAFLDPSWDVAEMSVWIASDKVLSCVEDP